VCFLEEWLICTGGSAGPLDLITVVTGVSSHLRSVSFADSFLCGKNHPICWQHEQLGKERLKGVSFAGKIIPFAGNMRN
jgi:hypothetical protein